jgi:hypothetical protein
VAALLPTSTAFGEGQSGYKPRYLSDSGRLFFDGLDALVPQDVNATGDVYEFEPQGYTNEEGRQQCSEETATFNGCKVGADKCHSEGSENNEQIKTGPLEGTLAYISKTAKTTGIDFKAEGSEYWTTMICFSGSKQRVRGSIVMPITSVNKLATKFALAAHGSSSSYEDEAGLKHLVKLEGEIIGGKVFEPLSWEFEDLLTTSRNIEIKA